MIVLKSTMYYNINSIKQEMREKYDKEKYEKDKEIRVMKDRYHGLLIKTLTKDYVIGTEFWYLNGRAILSDFYVTWEGEEVMAKCTHLLNNKSEQFNVTLDALNKMLENKVK